MIPSHILRPAIERGQKAYDQALKHAEPAADETVAYIRHAQAQHEASKAMQRAGLTAEQSNELNDMLFQHKKG